MIKVNEKPAILVRKTHSEAMLRQIKIGRRPKKFSCDAHRHEVERAMRKISLTAV